MSRTAMFALGIVAAALTIFVLAATPAPASPPLVYEGTLWRDGRPFHGAANLEFHLFDLPVVGTELAQSVQLDRVQVIDGRFAATLPFDLNLMDGRPRWIEVRVDGQAQPDRELIMATGDGVIHQPDVLMDGNDSPDGSNSAAHGSSKHRNATGWSHESAAGAESEDVTLSDTNSDTLNDEMARPESDVELGTVGWQVSGNNIYFLGGQVGIGTNDPTYRLTVKHPSTALWVAATNGSGVTYAVRGRVSSDDGYAAYFQGGQNYFDGRVGIGTPSPMAKLDVRGDLRLGSSGQFFASSGNENLRTLRGRISSNGFVVNGSGFSSIRLAPGLYKVTFGTAFSSTPTVTANAITLNDGGVIVNVYALSTNLFEVKLWSPLGAAVNSDFAFIVTGPR